MATITDLRVVLQRAGHCDGGEYVKPQWALLYLRDGSPCKRPVKCGGDRKPLGQDVIDAARGLGVSEHALLDCPVID